MRYQDGLTDRRDGSHSGIPSGCDAPGIGASTRRFAGSRGPINRGSGVSARVPRVPGGRSASARGSLTHGPRHFVVGGWRHKGEYVALHDSPAFARSRSRGMDPVERVDPSRGRRARCPAELHSVSSLVKSLSRPGMLHADSSDWPSLAIGGAPTMDTTSCGDGYRRSTLRTDEPKPTSLADCVSRTAPLDRKRAFPTVPACDPDAGQCEIPTLSVPAAGTCQVSLHIQRNQPCGNPNGLLSSFNFSHFSFAVWLVLVYNEQTERG